jgi:glycine/D-amino acid oxidase-like deaminating enzyme
MIAAHVAEKGRSVVLVEQDDDLMLRASHRNQARLHGGYHYPRSLQTAFRCRHNFQRFMQDFPEAVQTEFLQLYAIARVGSKVTAKQFERFCAEIGAPLHKVEPDILGLFSHRLVEAVYEADEHTIDLGILRSLMRRRLEACGVEIMTGTAVTGLVSDRSGVVVVEASGKGDYLAEWVFNCTYSGLCGLVPSHEGDSFRLKHEFTEMPVIRVPSDLKCLSITVMDGPFFSVMPFPERDLWTLHHVRYTPLFSWTEETTEDSVNAGALLRESPRRSQFSYMIRDAARYVDRLRAAEYVDSIFEVKTVLLENEVDDGRPILFDRTGEGGRIVSVLGSKLDNVYDVLAYVDGALGDM